MIFVVLGMHKSGTTLISKMLHESGINMGEFNSSISYDAGNKYERLEFQKINMSILNCGKTFSLNVITPLDEHFDDISKGEEITLLSKQLIESYEQWGFKDPRTCLSYAFWNNYLPKHKVIVVYRSPLEVWHHYRKNIPKYRIFRRFSEGCKALNAWCLYNQQILMHIKNKQINGYLIEYSNFMEDPDSIKKLSAYVDKQLDDCRDRSLYRAKKITDLGYKLCLAFGKLFIGREVERIFLKLEKMRTEANYIDNVNG